LLGAPAISAATPTATPTSSSSTMRYDFEGTTQGWTGGGTVGIATVSDSAAAAYSGTHSLAVALTNISQANWGSAVITNAAGLTPGVTIEVHVLEPSGLATGLAASIVVQGASWNEEMPVALTPGTWATLTYTLPSYVTLGSPNYLAVR